MKHVKQNVTSVSLEPNEVKPYLRSERHVVQQEFARKIAEVAEIKIDIIWSNPMGPTMLARHHQDDELHFPDRES